MRRSVAGSLLLLAAACACGGTETPVDPVAQDLRARLRREFPLAGSPATTASDSATPMVQLGESLFFDPNLSSCGTVACASCHQPDRGFSDGRRVSVGCGGIQGRRNSPALYGVAYLNRFFWDGRATSLERQALAPVSDPREMASNWEDVLHYLSTGEHRGTGVRYPEAVRYYRDAFQRSFQGILSAETVASALAAYQRTLVSTGSAFDRWLAGDDGAFSPAQVQGALIFFGRARCGECHPPPAFTDSQFHNVGVPRAGHESPELFPVNSRICGGVPDHVDPGRAGTEEPVSCEDLGAFRTPSLRNVELSPPYMHNGVFGSLENVVLHYWNVGRGTTNPTAGELDRRMRLIRLTDSGGHPDDIRNLVEFLKGLTGSTRSGPPGGIAPPGGVPGSLSPTSSLSRPAPGRQGS